MVEGILGMTGLGLVWQFLSAWGQLASVIFGIGTIFTLIGYLIKYCCPTWYTRFVGRRNNNDNDDNDDDGPPNAIGHMRNHGRFPQGGGYQPAPQEEHELVMRHRSPPPDYRASGPPAPAPTQAWPNQEAIPKSPYPELPPPPPPPESHFTAAVLAMPLTMPSTKPTESIYMQLNRIGLEHILEDKPEEEKKDIKIMEKTPKQKPKPLPKPNLPKSDLTEKLQKVFEQREKRTSSEK